MNRPKSDTNAWRQTDNYSPSTGPPRPPRHHPTAIQAITNLRPHAGQAFPLEFRSALTEIFASSRTTGVKLEWCPSEASIAGIHRCIDLARANAAAPLPPDHQEPNTIAFQRSSTKEQAISAWQGRWHNADRRSQHSLPYPLPRPINSRPSLREVPAQPAPPWCASSPATRL